MNTEVTEKPVLTRNEIEFQIQLIEKDIATFSQKLFQAQGALLMMKDLAAHYSWKEKDAPSSPA